MQKEKGKYIFGVVKVGERGQIVIPAEARKVFDIKAGDALLILGDTNKGGMAIVKTDIIQPTINQIMEDKK